MSKMKIDIWSDIACPYCYVGLKKLQLALGKFDNKEKVELVWHSYQLNPELAVSPKENYNEHLAQSLGISAEEVEEDSSKIGKLGREVGLNFQTKKTIPTNTSYALRLVKLAAEKGTATETEELLFKAYFTDGKNVSAKETLLEIGKAVGVSEKDIDSLFSGKIYEWEVKEDSKYGDETLDLEYIPYYIFNNEHVIQGSVEMEDYAKVLEKSFKEWQEHGVSTKRGEAMSGQACAVDGTGC